MTTFAESLAAPWLDVEPDDLDSTPELALTDRAGADRHLVAIARIEAEFALEQAGALAEVERIQAWIARRFEETTAQANWHRDVLHRYHQAVLARDPRRKTIKLPHGELQARAQQPAWEIDAPTALAWLAENLPSVVRPPKPGEPTIDVPALKRSVVIVIDDEGFPVGVVSPDGEVVPGITVTERDPKFSTVVAQDEPEEHDGDRALAEAAEAEWQADQANAMADERDACLDRAENDADDRASAMADARDYIESVAGEPF